MWIPVPVFLNYLDSLNWRFPEVVSQWLLSGQAWLYLEGKMPKGLFWTTCTFLTLKPWPGMKLMQCKKIENIPAYSFPLWGCTFTWRFHFCWMGTGNWSYLFNFEPWKLAILGEYRGFEFFFSLISSNRINSFCCGRLLIWFLFF